MLSLVFRLLRELVRAILLAHLPFASGSSTTAAVTVSSGVNELVYSITAFNNGSTHTPAGGQTELFDGTINSSVSGSANTRLGAASVNMSVTSTSAPWSMVGVGIKPATSPGGGAIWHQADLQQNTATSGNATVARPTNLSSGDLILVILSDRDNPTITAPAGFNLIRTETGGSDNAQVAAYWKIATASEPTSYTFTRSTNRNWRATAVRVTNFNVVNPIGSNSGANRGGSGGETLDLPAITTTAPNALVVAAVAMHNTVDPLNAVAGMTTRWNNASPRPANGGFTQEFAVAGSTGIKNITWSDSRRAAGMLFEINAFREETTAPGGVLGTVLWLKANDGTNTTTDGGNVTLWDDQSPLAVTATGFNTPTYISNANNFNPAINLVGASSEYFSLPSGYANFLSGVTAYVVVKPATTANWARFFDFGNGASNNNLFLAREGTTSNLRYRVFDGATGTGNMSSTTNPIVNGESKIFGVFHAGGTAGSSTAASMFDNGQSILTGNAAVPNNITRTINYVGRSNWAADAYYNGEISEIILYNSNKALDRARIESYLAIKYGITLSQASAQNYVNSANTVVWNATTNAGYNNNIAGIARDDSSALNQKQSRSVNAGLQITVGNGNTIAATNQANIQNFIANNSALIWGDNNASVAAWTNTGAPIGYQVIPRTWRVQETGTVNSVKIRVADNSGTDGLPNEGSRIVTLLVNNSGNFTSGSTIYPMTLNGTNWEVDVNLNSGQYFTFSACEVGDVIFALGATSSRCQGAGSVTYTATATNSSAIAYQLDSTSLAAGNTINGTTGQVTYVGTWSGTSTITSTATGCETKIGTHTVTVNPSVAIPEFTLGVSSQRCRAAGTVTYTANAANSTAITYSLDATTLAAGNTINASTGAVTYVAGWAGTSVITASAAGCNGPTIATHQATSSVIFAIDDAFSGVQGMPLTFNVLSNDLCNINLASVAIVSAPGLGFLQNNGNGQFTYLPIGDFIGDISFTYQVCSNAPVVCDTATVTLNIFEKIDDPCFEANQKKLYYMPFPESDTLQLKRSLISAASSNLLTPNVRNITSISIPYPRTVIIYDHWEDGYEANIENPVQSTTQVWGDGNAVNGVAPGYPTDIIPPGGFIILDSTFAWHRPTPNPSIQFDGRDKIFSSAAISVTKVTGDGGFTGAIRLFDVQNVKTNVPDVSRYGQFFVLPFGENVTLGGTSAFRYTGLFVSASEDSTVIQLDYDGNGTTDVTSPVLNEGEVWFYNGAATQPGVNNGANVNTATDIKAGARVLANKAVGVNLVFGGIDTYGTRNLPVFPSQFYGNDYISSVYSTNATAPVYAFFVNPGSNPITINWTRAAGAPLTGSFTVAANNGVNFFDINTATGMRFQSAGGEPFTAVGIIDADAAGSTYDWAFNMIPTNRLTDFATIAWAPGTSNGTNNYNPVWVTPSQTTTVYVKYDGDLTTGPNLSPCIARYDTSFVVNALESRLIFGLNNDNSGMGVYNCDSVPLSLAWGQRPFGGTPTASPSIDVGYTMDPKCLSKLIFATEDRYVTGQNTPINFDVRVNDAAYLTILDSASVSTLGLPGPSNGTVVINPDNTVTYTPNLGFVGSDQFNYRICAEAPDGNICDIATVFIEVPCANVPGQNVINGVVFADRDLSGSSSPADIGIQGIEVQLYDDLNGNGQLNPGEPLLQSQNTSADGSYQFTLTQDLRMLHQFNTNGVGTGNNGTVNFSGAWQEIVEADGFGAGSIIVAGNALRIAGNGATSQAGARRAANLSSAIQATLTYDFSKTSFSSTNNDWVDVQVGTSATGPWTTLVRYSGQSATTGSASFDITNWISGTTNIRFVESTDNGFINSENVTFDNVQIQYFINTNYIVQMNPASIVGYDVTVPLAPDFYAVSFAGANNGDCNSLFGLSQADLSITKVVDVERPQVGDTVTFTIDISNLGPTAASGVVVSDQLPTGLTYISHIADLGTYNSGTGQWSIPLINFGGTAQLLIAAQVTVDALPFVDNIAAVVQSNQSDPVLTNNQDTARVEPYPNATFAVNDQNSTWQNTPVSGNILTNDFDLEEIIPKLSEAF